jgi:hypothetical protein
VSFFNKKKISYQHSSSATIPTSWNSGKNWVSVFVVQNRFSHTWFTDRNLAIKLYESYLNRYLLAEITRYEFDI